MLKTVLAMATVALIACAAGVVIFEHLTRARQPQVGPPPRRRPF